MNLVEQGATYEFEFELSGDALDGITVSMSVLQKPGETPAIQRNLTYADGAFTGTLTSAETAALDIGQWFIHLRSTDADEDIRETQKIYVTKGWV